jgi:hypothetical protein
MLFQIAALLLRICSIDSFAAAKNEAPSIVFVTDDHEYSSK